ncbi:hypothetical protein V5738_01235 [Salinisphaera sp. SPP-AMP-43]|uniref:hypothetical protein n=1 Tax=Salinisphaera sp. SPP-AMP-43 TaxID=3121288 RepID=UPI003C6E0302
MHTRALFWLDRQISRRLPEWPTPEQFAGRTWLAALVAFWRGGLAGVLQIGVMWGLDRVLAQRLDELYEPAFVVMYSLGSAFLGVAGWYWRCGYRVGAVFVGVLGGVAAFGLAALVLMA